MRVLDQSRPQVPKLERSARVAERVALMQQPDSLFDRSIRNREH